MTIVGQDYLESLLGCESYSAKMVFNEHGAIFFPVKAEHRDQKLDGVSYEDDYRGNALAAMLAPQKIEIRYHKAFSDERVARIISDLTRLDGLAFLRTWDVSYQGRHIDLGGAC